MDDGLKNILVGAGLERIIGGFSKQSGFIRRLMAENAVAHKGQYGNPTTLHPKSTMNKPAIFKYKKLATPGQQGTKQSGNPYGASPFIQRHFGTIEKVPFVRRFGAPYPTEPFSKAKKGRKAKAEKPQRQLTAEEEDFLAPVGFEGYEDAPASNSSSSSAPPPRPARVQKPVGEVQYSQNPQFYPPAPVFQAPKASPELQHPELDRPLRPKKLKVSQNPMFANRTAAQEEQEVEEEEEDEESILFEADVKKFVENKLFVIGRAWLEHEKGKALNSSDMIAFERLMDKAKYPEINPTGSFTSNKDHDWGTPFPWLKKGTKEEVEARESFLRALYTQNPKFKDTGSNPFMVIVRNKKIFVGRTMKGYHNRKEYYYPEWTGPYTSWEDFSYTDTLDKWVSVDYWDKHLAAPYEKPRRRPA